MDENLQLDLMEIHHREYNDVDFNAEIHLQLTPCEPVSLHRVY